MKEFIYKIKLNNKSIIMYKNIANTDAFTLVELTLVIAVLGILATVLITSFPGAQKKARDTERINDVQQYTNALENYFTANEGQYPPADGDIDNICASLSFNTSECPKAPDGASYKYKAINGGVAYFLYSKMELSSDDGSIKYYVNCSNGLTGEITSDPSSDSDCPLVPPTPTFAPTDTPLPTNTPTPSPTITNTPTPATKPTNTPTPVTKPTSTPTPTSTNTPIPTATNTPTPPPKPITVPNFSFESGTAYWNASNVSVGAFNDGCNWPPSYHLNCFMKLAPLSSGDIFISSDYITLPYNVNGRSFNLNMRVHAHNVGASGNQIISNVAVQCIPKDGDWSWQNTYRPIANKTLTNNNWTLISGDVSFSGTSCANQIRIILRPAKNTDNNISTYPVYYDYVRLGSYE